MSQCKCSQAPFLPNPPCREQCRNKSLSHATRDDLVNIFHIEPRLADKISRINAEHPGIFKIHDFREHLNGHETDTLDAIFANLKKNDAAVKWLKKKFGPEDDIAGVLKDGGPEEVIAPEANIYETEASE